MGGRRLSLAIFLALGFLLALPEAAAGPSPNYDAIQNLFNIILIPALLIGGLVYVLVLSAVVLFRRKPGRRPRPPGRVVTEHRALEIAWTLIPAFVLIFVGFLSIQVLSEIEYVPPGAREIIVTGHQWFWSFTDPATNNTTQNELTVEVGTTVHVHVHSVDVIHSFYIPDMGIKIDAFPNRFTDQWFRPMVPGTYIIHCAEFCGLGHAGMKARLVVVPKPSALPSGAQRAAPSPATPGTAAGIGGHLLHASQAAQSVEIQLHDGPGCPGGRLLCIIPDRLNANSGTQLELTIRNTGAMDHNFTLDRPYDVKVERLIHPGETVRLIVNITQAVGAFYWCAVPGHRQGGMLGALVVDGNAPSGGGGPPELPLAQWMMLGAIGVAVASAAVYHVRAVRRQP